MQSDRIAKDDERARVAAVVLVVMRVERGALVGKVSCVELDEDFGVGG